MMLSQGSSGSQLSEGMGALGLVRACALGILLGVPQGCTGCTLGLLAKGRRVGPTDGVATGLRQAVHLHVGQSMTAAVAYGLREVVC